MINKLTEAALLVRQYTDNDLPEGEEYDFTSQWLYNIADTLEKIDLIIQKSQATEH